MAIMTMEPATLKKAMGKIGLKERANELLDLELSWEECLRGEHEDVFKAIEEIRKEINER
jgi:hypothetical protein